MSLLSSMIVTVCMGTQGDYNSACNAALDAGAQQTGMATDVKRAERNTTQWVDNVAEDKLGKNGKGIAGGMIFVIKTAADRTLVVPIPTGGIANKIDGQFSPDKAMIMFRWSF